MGKYHETPLTMPEMSELAALIKALHDLSPEYIFIDHIQIGDMNGDIIGKLQFEADPEDDDINNGWAFHPRKHDKPGRLGE